MSIFYSILSTQNYKHSRQEWLKKTWLSRVSSDFLFLSDENSSDSVKLSDIKDYTSCEEKQLNSISYLVSNKSQYDWFFFCDDDTYVNTLNLEKLVSGFRGDSCGFVLSRETDRYNPAFSTFGIQQYYSGGAGFLVKRSLLQQLAALPRPPVIGYADISFGRLLNQRTKLIHSPLFFPTSVSKLGHSNSISQNSITYHYVNEGEMFSLYHDSLK